MLVCPSLLSVRLSFRKHTMYIHSKVCPYVFVYVRRPLPVCRHASTCLHAHLYICQSVHLHACVSISTCLSVCLPVYPLCSSDCMTVSLHDRTPNYLPYSCPSVVGLPVCLFRVCICPSICVSVQLSAVCLRNSQSACLSECLFVGMFRLLISLNACRYVFVHVCPYICLPVRRSIRLPVPVCNPLFISTCQHASLPVRMSTLLYAFLFLCVGLSDCTSVCLPQTASPYVRLSDDLSVCLLSVCLSFCRTACRFSNFPSAGRADRL